MMPINSPNRARLRAGSRNQRGLALIVVLLMLSLIFVLGAISARLATTAERTARADRDRQIAYQAAEAALADAELDIMDPDTTRGCKFPNIAAEPGCSSDDSLRGVCTAEGVDATKPLFRSIDFNNTDDATRQYVHFGEFTGRSGSMQTGAPGLPAREPRYIIQKTKLTGPLSASGVGGQDVFVVTAVGYGSAESTVIVLQSTVYKPALSSTKCSS